MAKKENNELEKRNQAFLIYQDENGIARVNVRFEGDASPKSGNVFDETIESDAGYDFNTYGIR